MVKHNICKSVLLVLFVIFTSANIPARQAKNQVPESGNWAPNTKAAIDEVIKKNAGQKNAYAVFDWDNTSIFGDVQDMLFFYQIEHLEFKMTPEQFKYSLLHYMDVGYKKNLEIPTEDFEKSFCNSRGEPINIKSIAEDCLNDYIYFYQNYSALNPKAKTKKSLDEIKATDQFNDFRAKMWFTYEALYKSFSPNVAYTWVMFVTVPGYNISEFKSMVEKAIDWGIKRECTKNDFNSPSSLPGRAGVVSNTSIGNRVLNTVRPIPEMGALFNQLEKNGIPVYISTASLQTTVEVFATNPKYGYNLKKNRVLGLRLKTDSKGRFLPQYDISGGYTINSMAGKTLNINKYLVPKYKANPVLIAGDSDGDTFMMTEFSGLNGVKMVNKYKPVQLVLVVNRLKKGRIGEICKIAAGQLDGKQKDKTVVVLQGRDENTGSWIPTEKTINFGLSSGQAKILP